MKTFSLFLLCWLIFTSPVDAGNPWQKLGRGFTNVVTAPLEIPKQTDSEWKRGRQQTFHVLVWILSGFVKGLAYFVGRTGSGTWDILTFPFPLPPDYQPLMKPNFIFQ